MSSLSVHLYANTNYKSEKMKSAYILEECFQQGLYLWLGIPKWEITSQELPVISMAYHRYQLPANIKYKRGIL